MASKRSIKLSSLALEDANTNNDGTGDANTNNDETGDATTQNDNIGDATTQNDATTNDDNGVANNSVASSPAPSLSASDLQQMNDVLTEAKVTKLGVAKPSELCRDWLAAQTGHVESKAPPMKRQKLVPYSPSLTASSRLSASTESQTPRKKGYGLVISARKRKMFEALPAPEQSFAFVQPAPPITPPVERTAKAPSPDNGKENLPSIPTKQTSSTTQIETVQGKHDHDHSHNEQLNFQNVEDSDVLKDSSNKLGVRRDLHHSGSFNSAPSPATRTQARTTLSSVLSVIKKNVERKTGTINSAKVYSPSVLPGHITDSDEETEAPAKKSITPEQTSSVSKKISKEASVQKNKITDSGDKKETVSPNKSVSSPVIIPEIKQTTQNALISRKTDSAVNSVTPEKNDPKKNKRIASSTVCSPVIKKKPKTLGTAKNQKVPALQISEKKSLAADSTAPAKLTNRKTLGTAQGTTKEATDTRNLRKRKVTSYKETLLDEEEDLFLLEGGNSDDDFWRPDDDKSRHSFGSNSDSDNNNSRQASPSARESKIAAPANHSNDSVRHEPSETSDPESDNEESEGGELAAAEKITTRSSRRKRNKLRNTGQEYISSSGKTVRARECRPLPNCRTKWCHINQLSDDERNKIFQEYWALGDHDKRVQYVSSRIQKKEVKNSRRRDANNPKKERTCTLEYSLIYNEQRLVVSKGCFLATLDENDRFVRDLLSRRSTTVQVPDDKRGKHAPHNKFSEEVKQEVITHIRKFPAYVSHYSRRHTAQLYLGAHLNVSIMHKLYLEEGGTRMSYNTYLDIFNGLRPRLKFKTPHVDTCVTCDTFQNSIQAAQSPEEKQNLQQELDLHVQKADFAYECKKIDRQEAKNSSKKMVTVVFDLEQVLPCPYLTSGNVFYLRQLSVYNLTVFETTAKQAFNFMWHEGIAGRGADEIASCILAYIQEFLPLSVKHMVLYSDTCSGQNKNSLMITALSLTVQQHPSLEIIDQKFLVPGHTHLECDQAHHQIEMRKKKTNIALHHPQNYYDMVKEVGPAQKRFVVREMKQRDIFKFEPSVKGTGAPLVWRKTDSEGNPFLFGNAEWFRFQSTCPGIILYKKTLNKEEPFVSLDWKRKRKQPLPEIEITQKRNTPCPISCKKKEDLLSLLDQINPLYHDFYKRLADDKDVIDEDADLLPEFDVANEFAE